MSNKLNVPEMSPNKKGKRGNIFYPIHNHLETEPCTESCPNYRANHIKTETITIKAVPAEGYTIPWDVGW